MVKLKHAVKKFCSPQGNLFRYSLSFCLLLALLPALIILLKIFQNDLLDETKLVNLLYDYVPKILLSPFIEYVLSQEYTTFISLVISSVFSIYLASNAIYSFMLISMTDENFSSYAILVRLKAVVLFIVLVMGIVGLTFLSYIIPNYTSIVILGGLFIVFYFFYRFLSFEKRPPSYGVIGAIFTSVGIVLIGMFFFYIVDNYTRYYALYGPLASLMILLISIYLISNVIYFGYCLNHEYGKSYPEIIFKHFNYYEAGNRLIERIINWLKRKFIK